MEYSDNHISLRGTLAQSPQLSHENHATPFYRFLLEVPRLSGTLDILPVVAPGPLLEGLDLQEGDSILAEGQIRSHNIQSADGRHLQIFLFPAVLNLEEGPSLNEVSIRGTICRKPILRRTPLGREICDLMLAVPRAFHRADYLPCILWGSTAQEAARCQVRDRISIEGRLQSRNYTKLLGEIAETRTAYEVSAMTAEIPEDLYG